MYKALIDIGGYKKGEEVPSEMAEVWEGMYKESPVELAGSESVKAPAKESVKHEPVKKKPNPMLDDYLARGTNVVVKNVRQDNLPKTDLVELLKLEKSGKKRAYVISVIEKKMESSK